MRIGSYLAGVIAKRIFTREI